MRYLRFTQNYYEDGPGYLRVELNLPYDAIRDKSQQEACEILAAQWQRECSNNVALFRQMLKAMQAESAAPLDN